MGRVRVGNEGGTVNLRRETSEKCDTYRLGLGVGVGIRDAVLTGSGPCHSMCASVSLCEIGENFDLWNLGQRKRGKIKDKRIVPLNGSGNPSDQHPNPVVPAGPVAQWITRLTTDQKIPGSNPGRIETFRFSEKVYGQEILD